MAGTSGNERAFRVDERGLTVTNTAATATLVVLAVLLGAGLGAGVLLGTSGGDDGGPPEANFTFSYFSQSSALIVTFDHGEEIPAGELRLTNGRGNATWAEVAHTNDSTMVGEGDTVQLSRRSAFGAPVTRNQPVYIRWTGSNGTRELATWPKKGS
ncbi:MAG: type IV pilin [Haloarculaceae archaeon]